MTLETLEKVIVILTGVTTLVAGLAAALKKLSVGAIIRWMVAAILVCGLLGVAVLVVASLQPKEGEKEKAVANERKPHPAEPEVKGGQDKEKAEPSIFKKEAPDKEKASPSTVRQGTPKNGRFVGDGDTIVSLGNLFAGLPNTLVAKAEKPTDADYDDANGKLRLKVTVRVDDGKYKAFLKPLLPVLDKMAVAKSSHLLVAERRKGSEGSRILPVSHYFLPRKPSSPFSSVGRLTAKYRDKSVVAVLTHIDAALMRSKWETYCLDRNSANKAVGAVAGNLTVEVSLLGSDGEWITEDIFGIRFDVNAVPRGYAWCGWREAVYGLGGRVIEANCIRSGDLYHDLNHFFASGAEPPDFSLIGIAPLAFHPQSDWNGDGYLPSVTYSRQITLAAKDFARLKEVRCTVRFRPN